MSKIISIKESVSKIQDGSTIMVGGFYTIGTPEIIVNEILAQNKKNLTKHKNYT